MSTPPRLLLIGWDSADWRMIRPLLAAGKMPNLQRLVANGVSGNLATLQPVLSPILWTSIATGKRADKHGILGFVEPDPASGSVRPVTNLSRKTKAVWNILCQNGRRCNVIGWWPSHPAEPINGVMVSNQFQTALDNGPDDPWPLRAGTVHPAPLAEHLASLRLHPLEVNGDTLLPFVPRAAEIDQRQDQRLVGLAKTVAETASVHAVATGVLQLEPWDFMAVYYDGLDHFGHRFMKYHPPRREGITEADSAMFGGVMEAAYRYHDLMLGVLLDLAGPDTRVLLLSDHGFHPDHLRPHALSGDPTGPAAEHRNYGIFVMAGPGLKRGETLAGGTLLDIAPTILHAFGLPVGEDMDGKVLLPVFAEPTAVERIPSWDAVAGEDGTHPPGAVADPQNAAGALRQLVDLGYIEAPDEDKAVASEEAVRELRYHLAQSLIDGQRFPEAAQILEELWERWPEESRFGLKLLSCRLALNLGAEARKVFTLLRTRRHETAEQARAELEAFEQAQAAAGTAPEQWSEADQHKVRRWRARAATDVRALRYFEAQVLMVEGDHERARELFAGLVDSASPDRRLPLFLNLGEICLQLRRWTEASTHFAAALALDAENAAAHLGLARAALFQKRVLEATAHGLKAVELDFHNPRAHFFYGVALSRCGHPDWAVDSLLEAVRQAPTFPGAHRRLARLYARALGDPAKAAHHAELALRAADAASEHDAALAMVSPPSDDKTDPPSLVESNLFNVTGKASGSPEDWIVVVTGLPRSGTSMMMQLLAAGGIKPFTDGQRAADASNEEGYLETEQAKRLVRDNRWLADARGHAVKVVVPLVQHLPSDQVYKIIYVDRPLEEVLASQTAMLERLGKRRSLVDAAALRQIFARQAARCQKILSELPRCDCLTVQYQEAVKEPGKVAAGIASFLAGAGLDVDAMSAAVKPRLYRSRQAKIEH